MIVIVIIGILAAIAIPKFSGMSSRAKQSEADMLLKQLYTLQLAYTDRYHGYAASMDDLTLVGWAPPGLSHFGRPEIVSGGGPGSTTFTACMTAVDPELASRSIDQSGKMGGC
jgi:type IV pilus assembly protein PilE